MPALSRSFALPTTDLISTQSARQRKSVNQLRSHPDLSANFRRRSAISSAWRWMTQRCRDHAQSGRKVVHRTPRSRRMPSRRDVVGRGRNGDRHRCACASVGGRHGTANNLWRDCRSAAIVSRACCRRWSRSPRSRFAGVHRVLSRSMSLCVPA